MSRRPQRPRETAADGFRRIMAIVPWIAERDGPRIDEVCERFDVSREQLLEDLDVVFMVGIPPYTPDELIDVIIEDDRVWVTLGRYFTRPLNLTATEALGVLAAGSGLLATAGSDAGGPLERALDKLRAAMGVRAGDLLGIDLGGADSDVLRLVQEAAATRRTVEIDYYSYSTDEHRVRLVDPFRVYATDGNWYVIGYCHTADAERLFRVDRIRTATLTDATFEAPAEVPAATSFAGSRRDRLIAIEVGPADRWIAEHYPTKEVEDLGGERWRVRLAVGGEAWLERLLLRLGADAEVVPPPAGTNVRRWVTPEQARDIVRSTARRIAEIYRN